MLDIDRQSPKIAEAIEAEQALLGAVLLDPKQLDVVSDVVNGAEFYDCGLGKLLAAMIDLRQAGKPISDTMLLVRELESMKLLSHVAVDGISGRPALARLTDKCQSAGHAPLYASQVRDYAGLRRLALCATRAWGETYSPDATGLRSQSRLWLTSKAFWPAIQTRAQT